MFYNLDDEIFITKDFEFLNEGMCAKLYRLDDIVLKIYKFDCTYKYYIRKSMFNKLKELNIPNIVELLDYYYYYKSKLYKLLPPDAYTMKYVEDDNISILNTNVEYLLETISSLEKTCLKLSKNKIEINDAHSKNIIFNKNGATLVDVDSFCFSRLKSFQKLFLYNQKQIVKYLKSRLINEYNSMNIYTYKLNYLLDFNSLTSNISITDELKKIMDKKTPIESLRKYLK